MRCLVAETLLRASSDNQGRFTRSQPHLVMQWQGEVCMPFSPLPVIIPPSFTVLSPVGRVSPSGYIAGHLHHAQVHLTARGSS